MRDDRNICLGENLCPIPIELLRAQASGKILFIVGAGVSMGSGLPSFRDLVKDLYKKLDISIYEYIKDISSKTSFCLHAYPGLNPSQLVEVRAFCEAEYDLVLGLLERRLDTKSHDRVEIRTKVADILHEGHAKPSSLHQSIIDLSNRGDAVAVITTNYDLLLEEAGKKLKDPPLTYSMGEIMRPSYNPEFSGILHIHGALSREKGKFNDIVLTDQDFGQYYLRGRSLSDFIYDASRLYTIVLIGYSANDPPMKYLLSAVAADRKRFPDIKNRYIFLGEGERNDIDVAYWEGRGIKPIYYKANGSNHSVLEKTLERWVSFALIKNRKVFLKKEMLRIVKQRPFEALESDRDCFEFILDLSSNHFRGTLLKNIAEAGAHLDWLDIAIGKDVDDEKMTVRVRHNLLMYGDSEKKVYDDIKAFLNSYPIMTQEILNWALNSDKNSKIKHLVIQNMFENPFFENIKLKEPWSRIWGLVIESWISANNFSSTVHGAYGLQRRLQNGERSISLARAIADWFRPQLIVEKHGYYGISKTKTKNPKVISDLLSIDFRGCPVSDLQFLVPEIKKIKDTQFLTTLARELGESIQYGFDVALQIGSFRNPVLWYTCGIKSIEYRGEEDPEEYSRGFSSIVKILHAVVERVGTIHQQSRGQFLKRWRYESDSLSVRFLASFASKWEEVSPNEIGEFLLQLDHFQFWKTQYYPEIAELQTNYFAQLPQKTQNALWSRIRKLPPKSLFSRSSDPLQIIESRNYSAFLITKRLEKEGVKLPPLQSKWLERVLESYPRFKDITIVTNLYEMSESEYYDKPIPNKDFDVLKGNNRLSAIEKALTKCDSAHGAIDWMNHKKNILLLIDDFAKSDNPIISFPNTIYRFYSRHTPDDLVYGENDFRDKKVDFLIVFALLEKTTSDRLLDGIKAYSGWLREWKKYFVLDYNSVKLWSRLIDIAEKSTIIESQQELMNPVLMTTEYGQVDNLEQRNHFSPIGNLVSVFIAKFPNLTKNSNPFNDDTPLSVMRSELMKCTGPAKDIVLGRFAEQLSYLLRADELWTLKNIIEPLKEDVESSRELWSSLSHRTLFKDTLKHIGDFIIPPCTDRRISRRPRNNLVVSVVVECLNSYRENRESLVSKSGVKQMIYLLDDEERANLVGIFSLFIKEVSKKESQKKPLITPEFLYTTAIQPFITEIWPKEQYMSTSMIAKAFADLPATTVNCFSDTVNLIERYLQPFDCYNMRDFGLYSGKEDEQIIEKIVSTAESAKALLVLLNYSIAYGEDPVRPYDLERALLHIKKIDEDLEGNPMYLRLSMLL